MKRASKIGILTFIIPCRDCLSPIRVNAFISINLVGKMDIQIELRSNFFWLLKIYSKLLAFLKQNVSFRSIVVTSYFLSTEATGKLVFSPQLALGQNLRFLLGFYSSNTKIEEWESILLHFARGNYHFQKTWYLIFCIRKNTSLTYHKVLL